MSIGIYRSLWMFMGIYEYQWVSWVSMGVYGFLDIYGYLWVSMSTYRCFWVLGCLWVFMGVMGVYGCL